MGSGGTVQFNEILCIGLGFSGICLGVQLKRKLHFTDIHFYDRNTHVAGTWHANRYPGSDVAARFYSFSFESNPDWSTMFPDQSDVFDYINNIADKYDLRRRMTLQTECESASWDSERQIWTVHLKDVVSGKLFKHECRVLFSAVGVLVTPKYPKIPGVEVFGGPMFHTARWRADVSLEGKDVALIGNGCSGTQVVPHIVPKAKIFTQFIHTPHWLFPATNPQIPLVFRWAFRYIPGFTLLTRACMFIVFEQGWKLFHLTESGAKARKAAEAECMKFIYETGPEKFHNLLIPDWDIACKRRVLDIDGNYLKSLGSPNVDLTKDPIVEFIPGGVRTATKTYPADVVIFATGFHPLNDLSTLRVYGRNGELLSEHWKAVGGPSGYNGTAVHGFPNFFMLYGPNGSTGHTSVIFTIENNVNFALEVIKPILRGEASEVEVKDDAEKTYTKDIQAASQDKIWTKCNSWYVSDNGWNATLYPWAQTYLWWRSNFPTWSDWSYKVEFRI
ncbi:4-hydroxyacetophenone monooxygenase [Hysterangium stoloniferum]|nr:4-hydroxyacetophenone monooxygenase [Hysterangium stoloniferum]